MNPHVIRCGRCKAPAAFSGGVAACSCGETQYFLLEGTEGVYLRSDLHASKKGEMAVRDSQAAGYLSHSKFPTQIAMVEKWLEESKSGPEDAVAGRAGRTGKRQIALDLGCGPGPYTRILQNRGYDVVAVDFSLESLKLNARSCRSVPSVPLFVQEDLRRLSLVENSVDLLLMADFLQHLEGREARERLLCEAFSALREGGRFYLSFFNLNLKNYLKGDVYGGFCDNKIRYERLVPKDVVSGFPNSVVVESVRPMNIAHGAILDNVLSALPFSMFLARMAVVAGRKSRQPLT